MNMNTDRHNLARKLATLAAVLVTAFLAGWSGMGLTGAIVFACALGGSAAVTIFARGATDCTPRWPRRRRSSR